jgi:tetratricopeptide (TPR) repeat protein
MSAAADAEDRTEKHPVTPGVPKPARELYGVMLLERGMPNEALAAFEATLKKEPNRLGAYVGAAKAAEKSGDSNKARAYYEKIVAIAGDADKSRTDVRCAYASEVALAEELATAGRNVVRTIFQLAVLGVPCDSPAGAGRLRSWDMPRRAGRVGADRQCYGK